MDHTSLHGPCSTYNSCSQSSGKSSLCRDVRTYLPVLDSKSKAVLVLSTGTDDKLHTDRGSSRVGWTLCVHHSFKSLASNCFCCRTRCDPHPDRSEVY